MASVGHPGQVNHDDRDHLLATRVRVLLILREDGLRDDCRRCLVCLAQVLQRLILAGKPLSTRNRECLWRLGTWLERLGSVRN